MVLTVYISSILIMVSRHPARLEGFSAENTQIRCIFRVIEFAEGIDGYIYSHEWMFWIFEALAMLMAIGVFCLFHPSKYLGQSGISFRTTPTKTAAHEMIDDDQPQDRKQKHTAVSS